MSDNSNTTSKNNNNNQSTNNDNSNDSSISELIQDLKSKQHYILYFVLFVMFVIEVYTLNRINVIEKDNSSTLNSINDLTSHIGINTLASGVVSLDLKVDEIRMPKSNENIMITEVTVNGVRQWDVPYYKAYIGDVITWTWSTNENIISCDSNLDIIVDNPTLNSGNLMVNGQFSFTFELPGTYYYTSQNSAGLSGVILITDYPVFTPGEITRGPIALIPQGIITNFDITYLDNSNCWKQCLNSKTNNVKNKYSADGIDVLFTDCDGDWIFMAQTTSAISSNIVTGAFGNKRNILNSNQYYGDYNSYNGFTKSSVDQTSLTRQPSSRPSTLSRPSSQPSLFQSISVKSFTAYENGAYWYNYKFSVNGNAGSTANSLSVSTVDSLAYNYGVGYIALQADCTNTLSWAYNSRNTWTDDYMKVCTSINSNGYEAIGTSTTVTTQYLYTNNPTCTVIEESSDIISQ